MNVTIQQTAQHTTFDGHPATYCVVRDALTAQRVAMVQVVDLGEGVIQYRTMDRRSMPPDFTLNDAIKLAMTYETKRRGTAPPRRQVRPEPRFVPSWHRNIRPMQLPPNRGYRRPSDSTRPMRQLLCQKLAERFDMKGAA